MILMRVLLCTAITCGTTFAAGPQLPGGGGSVQTLPPKATPNTLPPAMASAIDRLVKPGALKPPIMPEPEHKWFVLAPAPNAIVAQGPTIKQQCSIPLAESKVPANSPKFLIRQAPVGKKSPDAMPVLRAAVCAEQ
jgi:hypothetical protein